MFSAWMKQLAGRVGMQMASNAAPPMFIPDGGHVDHAHPDDDLDLLHHANTRSLSTGPLSNPWTFEDISAEMRFMDFDVYEGFKLEYARSVTPNFYMMHMLHLTPSKDDVSSYSVLGQFFSESVLEYLVARVESNYDFFGRFKKRIYGGSAATGDTKSVFVGALVRNADGSSEPSGMVEIDASTSTNWTNVQFHPAGQYVASFHQQLMPSLSAGVELLHNETHGVTLFKLASRFRAAYGTFIGAIQTNGVMQAQYVRNIEENRSTFGTELLVMPTQTGTMTSVVRLGWQQKFGDRIQVTSRVDTDYKIATQFETDTGIGQLSLLGELQHAEQIYKFGVGYRLAN